MLSGITQALLRVDESRRILEGNIARLIPPALGLVNLFVGALFEPLLKTDLTGHRLSLFFLLQTTFFAALTIAHFSGRLFPILKRSRIFPSTSADRYRFVVAANLRRRIVLALLLSTLFSLGAVYRHTPLVGVAAMFFYGLLICTSQTLLATIMLALARTPYPGASGLALGGLLCIGSAAGLLSPGSVGFSGILPNVPWGVGEAFVAGGGALSVFLLSCALIAATGACAAIIGSRTA